MQDQKDPHGKSPEQPGAKLDSGKIRAGLVINGFSRALEEVSKVGTFGANKYSDNGWMQVSNGIERYTDALHRHLLSEAKGEINDPESNLKHAAHAAWNALARLDLIMRSEQPIDSDKEKKAIYLLIKNGTLSVYDADKFTPLK